MIWLEYYQKVINFPAAPHEINADLLALMESNVNIEDDNEEDGDKSQNNKPQDAQVDPKKNVTDNYQSIAGQSKYICIGDFASIKMKKT